jgi:hypothetical protein
VLGSIAQTTQDPRRVAYVIPRAVDDLGLVTTLETGIGANYASLVATTAPGSRGVLITLLIESAVTLDAWGAAPVTFPGLPEQALTSATR